MPQRHLTSLCLGRWRAVNLGTLQIPITPKVRTSSPCEMRQRSIALFHLPCEAAELR